MNIWTGVIDAGVPKDVQSGGGAESGQTGVTDGLMETDRGKKLFTNPAGAEQIQKEEMRDMDFKRGT